MKCPCLLADEPCIDGCTCVTPHSSRGCLCCAQYGSESQRKKAANRIVARCQKRKPLDATGIKNIDLIASEFLNDHKSVDMLMKEWELNRTQIEFAIRWTLKKLNDRMAADGTGEELSREIAGNRRASPRAESLPGPSDFENGVLWSAARLVDVFDEPTCAEYLIRESGADPSLADEADKPYIDKLKRG